MAADDTPTSGRDRGPDDVAEAEAEAIEGESSAGEGEPPVDLTAPTTTDDATPASEGSSSRSPQGEDVPDDDRRMSQGSGQSSPSMGEQQTAQKPRPD